MYQKALSYYITMLYRSFADFTGDKLQEVGLNFGLLFFIVYIGKLSAQPDRTRAGGF